MKIMITGGMGFIGSHLATELLIEKHKLVILTKSFLKKNNITNISKKIKVEKIDVTDFKKLGKSIQKNKPDVIIHLAGQTSHFFNHSEVAGPIFLITSSTFPSQVFMCLPV